MRNLRRVPDVVPDLMMVVNLCIGNIRRRFRTRSRLSPDAEADPRRNNPCRSHLGPPGPSRDILGRGRGRRRRGAFANRDLPYGGPSPYRVPSGPSFAPCRSEAESSGSSEQELAATRWPVVSLHLEQMQDISPTTPTRPW